MACTPSLFLPCFPTLLQLHVYVSEIVNNIGYHQQDDLRAVSCFLKFR